MKYLLLIILVGLLLLQTFSTDKNITEMKIKSLDSLYSVYEITILDADKFKNKIIRMAFLTGKDPFKSPVSYSSASSASPTQFNPSEYMQKDCTECSSAATKRNSLRLLTPGFITNYREIEKMKLGEEQFFVFKRVLRLESLSGEGIDILCEKCRNGNRKIYAKVKFLKQCPVEEISYLSGELKKQNPNLFGIRFGNREKRKWIELNATCAVADEFHIRTQDVNISDKQLDKMIEDYYSKPRVVSPPPRPENKMSSYEQTYRSLIVEFQGKKRTPSQNSNTSERLQESLSPFYARLISKFNIKEISSEAKEDKINLIVTLDDNRKIELSDYKGITKFHLERLNKVNQNQINLIVKKDNSKMNFEMLYSDTYSFIEELLLYLIVQRKL